MTDMDIILGSQALYETFRGFRFVVFLLRAVWCSAAFICIAISAWWVWNLTVSLIRVSKKDHGLLSKGRITKYIYVKSVLEYIRSFRLQNVAEAKVDAVKGNISRAPFERGEYWKVGKFEQFYNRLWHESHKFSHCDTVVFAVGFGEVGVAFRIALQPQIGCCAFPTLCRLASARRTGICVCLPFAPLFSIRIFLASDMQTLA